MTSSTKNGQRTTERYAKSIETDAQTVASTLRAEAPLWVEPAGEARNYYIENVRKDVPALTRPALVRKRFSEGIVFFITASVIHD